MKDIIPIDILIKRSQELSYNPVVNKKELEEIRQTIISQMKIIKENDMAEIMKKMSNPNISDKEYSDCLKIIREIREYGENEEKISMILDRRYSLLSKDDKRITKRKPNKKKLVGFIVGGTLLLGLSGLELYYLSGKLFGKKEETTVSSEQKVTPQTEAITEYITEYVEPETTKQEMITTEKTAEAKSKYSEAEQITIVETFREMKDGVSDLYNSEGVKEARKTAKGYITNTIDFIFFNASINGITFDDLKQEFKDEIYSYLGTMDKTIMTFDPDYKEELEEKYTAVKDFSKKKLAQAKEIIINHIGQDRYDAIIAKKNEIVDKLADGLKKYGGKALDFIKQKYQEWKEE